MIKATNLAIVKNYRRGGQFSILAYGDFITEAVARSQISGRLTTWSPSGPFGRWFGSVSRGRWLRDLDVYVAAPLELWSKGFEAMHIVDNSNGWYALIARPRRLIITCHDLLPWLAARGRVQGWVPSPMARIFMWLNMVALRRADLVIAVSCTTRDVLIEAGIDPTRITVIANTVLVAAAPEEPPPSGLHVDRSTFFQLGAGKFYKNSGVILQAMVELARRGRRDIRLILVGKNSTDLISDLELPEVKAIDQLSAGQLTYLYRNSAGVLVPSIYEGFGLPVIEAQTLDCPVLSSDGGALAEVMGDSPTILPNPIDPVHLADAMVRTVDDAAFRSDAVRQGRLNLARFGRDETRNKYERFYNYASELGF